MVSDSAPFFFSQNMQQILQFSPKSLEVYVNDYIKHWNLTTSARYALSFVIGNNACVVWGRFILLCLLRKLWVSSKIGVCAQNIVSFCKSRVWVWRVSIIKELVSVLSESECGDILKVSSCTNFVIVELIKSLFISTTLAQHTRLIQSHLVCGVRGRKLFLHYNQNNQCSRIKHVSQRLHKHLNPGVKLSPLKTPQLVLVDGNWLLSLQKEAL